MISTTTHEIIFWAVSVLLMICGSILSWGYLPAPNVASLRAQNDNLRAENDRLRAELARANVETRP